jgi:hypothetical protein
MTHTSKLKELLLTAALIFVLAGCSRKPDNVIPEQLQGHWITDASGYEDRYLQLERDFVLIGINEDDMPSIQRVSRVESAQDGRDTIYTIYSSSPKMDYQISLYFNAANGGELRVKNRQQVLWKRKAAVPPPDVLH